MSVCTQNLGQFKNMPLSVWELFLGLFLCSSLSLFVPPVIVYFSVCLPFYLFVLFPFLLVHLCSLTHSSSSFRWSANWCKFVNTSGRPHPWETTWWKRTMCLQMWNVSLSSSLTWKNRRNLTCVFFRRCWSVFLSQVFRKLLLLCFMCTLMTFIHNDFSFRLYESLFRWI